MTQQIATLHPQETMTFDRARLAAVCDSHGHRAETFIAFVLTEIETLVPTLRAQVAARDGDGLRRSCTDVNMLAASIGMVTMDRASRAVLDCLDRGDATAAMACAARLVRLGRPGTPDGWAMVCAPADTIA
ncbi:hypothetical protein [Jannaschia rubra]|uniref:hypothetical protein n=1 Tax=Jannaschia rubra TaxID=282197 RepID=UPI00248FEE77|nr:hypothetical protein [Jannaschia rubra]